MTGHDLVVIGHVGRPHGVAGELRAHATGPTLGSLAPGADLLLRAREDGTTQTLIIEALRAVPRGLLLRLRGVSTREQAADMTGSEILVVAERLAAPQAGDEFFVRDLVGCDVTAGDRTLGTVADVYAGSANDALVVRGPDGDEVLVPFTHDAVVEVSLSRRVVRVRDDLLGASDR